VLKGHRRLVRSDQLEAGDWQCALEIYCQPMLQIFGPDLEGLAPASSVLGSSDLIAAEMEEVVDLIMG